jgi:hypothetical protein
VGGKVTAVPLDVKWGRVGYTRYTNCRTGEEMTKKRSCDKNRPAVRL